jgi:hypothetical protein
MVLVPERREDLAGDPKRGPAVVVLFDGIRQTEGQLPGLVGGHAATAATQ